MNEPFSIVPPPELIEQWMQAHSTKYDLARQAAQWGADQELEACLEHLFRRGFSDADILCLRAARRPKPPSSKEQVLAVLKRQSTRSIPSLVSTNDCDTIRRAMEASND
jgi:hypothetical protein